MSERPNGFQMLTGTGDYTYRRGGVGFREAKYGPAEIAALAIADLMPYAFIVEANGLWNFDIETLKWETGRSAELICRERVEDGQER